MAHDMGPTLSTEWVSPNGIGEESVYKRVTFVLKSKSIISNDILPIDSNTSIHTEEKINWKKDKSYDMSSQNQKNLKTDKANQDKSVTFWETSF